MSNTIIFEAQALLSTSSVSEQVMINARQAMESVDYDHSVTDLSPSEYKTVTGGTKGTLISTNLGDGADPICVRVNGVAYSLGSLVILPGGVGSIVITNTSVDAVSVDVVLVN